MLTLFLIVLSNLNNKIDHYPKIIDTYDILEVNHKHNEWGACDLDQVLAWDWHDRHNKHHVQWWKSMRDARKFTKEGEEKWLKKRRGIADKIQDWPTRRIFLAQTHYRGEFDKSSKYYPVKNWRTGYWEIRVDNRIIRAKIFRETNTVFDPEADDRKEYPTRSRRGLTKTLEEIKKMYEDGPRFTDQLQDFIGPIFTDK
jgi:hypothetical protein